MPPPAPKFEVVQLRLNAPGRGKARTFSVLLRPAVGPTASAPAVPLSLGPLAAPSDAAAPPDGPPDDPPDDPPDPPDEPPDPPLPPPRANALSATTIVAAKAKIKATTSAATLLMYEPPFTTDRPSGSKPLSLNVLTTQRECHRRTTRNSRESTDREDLSPSGNEVYKRSRRIYVTPSTSAARD